MLKNHNRPQIIPALEGVFIEDIAVGCEHILALSNTGDMYAWGCNCEAQVQSVMMFNDVFSGYLRICEYLVELMSSLCVLQLGLGHSNPVKEPTLVTALQGKNIRQISAGRCHTSAWTTPALSTRASGTNKSQWAALELQKYPSTCVTANNVYLSLNSASCMVHIIRSYWYYEIKWQKNSIWFLKGKQVFFYRKNSTKS